MNPSRRIIFSIIASFTLLAVPVTTHAQVAGEGSSNQADAAPPADATLLQKKAAQAQAQIRGNENDCGQLRKAIKLNEVASAKQVLLRNGFTAEDLENAKI